MGSFLLVCAMSMATGKIWLQDDKVYFRYDDQIGKLNFPIHEGIVTPPQLTMINQAAQDLSVFDGTVLVSWPKSLCRIDEVRPFLIDCSGRGQILHPQNSGLTTSGIATKIEANESLDFTYDRLKIQWTLATVASPTRYHFVTFPFNKLHCQAAAQSGQRESLQK